MILEAQGDSPGTPHPTPSDAAVRSALDLASSIAARYGISALSSLLESSRAALKQNEITVAVLGRFKAGKSSLLNDLIGRGVLPVGVVPVTTCVTEVRYGREDRAAVHYSDGTWGKVNLGQIGGFVAERENPENTKRVALVTIDLPELRRFAGLKFVDTPGLESALLHNTETSLEWLPNVGLALVTISVDPPLSERDIDLLKKLYRYTPKVLVLLTKADLLNPRELAEVVDFVRSQLARHLPEPPQVLPYSTRTGSGRFRRALEKALAAGTSGNPAGERGSIASRKVETLLRESIDFLTLSLRSAERVQSEREALKRQAVGERESLDDIRSQLHLLVQGAAGGTRAIVSTQLETHQDALESVLREEFETAFPHWTKNLATMLFSFEDWIGASLRDRLTAVSARDRDILLSPLHRVRKQAFRALQQFRDRLSERTTRAYGVPLRTTETEVVVAEPSTPDIRVGRVFDRNWELLSPIIPAFPVKGMVRRHFARKIGHLVYRNLSRSSTQWEESIHKALWAVEKESRRRMAELIGTVERLLETGDEQASQIRADLGLLQAALESIARKEAAQGDPALHRS